MERLKLNLVPGGVLTVCHASQYDNGRTVRFDLYDGDSKVTLAGTETITATLRKPSGAEVTLNVTNTSSDYVDVVTDSDTCDEAGVYLGELTVVSGSVIIGSANFILLAEMDPYGQAQLVVRSASGSIVNFNTSVVENLIECIADFSASQASGTPTPSAPIPIVGVDKVNVTDCGKNLFYPLKAVADSTGVTYTDGWINFKTNGANRIYYKNLNFGQVRISGVFKTAVSTTNVLQIIGYYSDGTNANIVNVSSSDTNEHSFVGSSSANKTLVEIRTGYTSSLDTSIKIQLEIGDTATTYEPYNGTTALINLGGTYYGGSVDAVTGKITLTHGYVDLGTLNWSYFVRNTRFVVILNNGKFTNSAFGLNTALCEIYPIVTVGYGIMPDKSISVGSNFISGSTCALVIHDEAYTTVNELKTALSGKHIAYELATPIVVYASNTAEIPTLNGFNQVYADTGDVAIKYYAKSTD